MVKMTLRQSSCHADESCIVYCNKEANLVLHCSDSVLARVTTTDGVYHFVWTDPHADLEIPEFCPIFKEDDEDAICEIEDIMVLQVNDIFCFGGEAYYLSQNNRGTLIVRRICLYSSQEIVEKIAWYDDDPEPVTDDLIKLYDLRGGKKFVMYTWQVHREHSVEYMPVFDGEDKLFDGLIHALTEKERMPVGSVLCHQHKSYVLLQDVDKKLYLSTSGAKFNLLMQAQRELGDKEEESSTKTVKVVRMIPMQQH